MIGEYVHGYSQRESRRLGDQASSVRALLHDGLRYAAGRRVLEVGCGTGDFICFVLEHLREPLKALTSLRRVLKAGGSVTVFEGDHGSWYCHPQTADASRTVQCLIEVQARLGGDSLIGRRLYPLLSDAGFRDIHVRPCIVYVDDSLPDLVETFSKNTFIAMVEGVREQALALGLIDEATWNKGIADMYRAAEPGGTFCYTFFRGTAVK